MSEWIRRDSKVLPYKSAVECLNVLFDESDQIPLYAALSHLDRAGRYAIELSKGQIPDSSALGGDSLLIEALRANPIDTVRRRMVTLRTRALTPSQIRQINSLESLLTGESRIGLGH